MNEWEAGRPAERTRVEREAAEKAQASGRQEDMPKTEGEKENEKKESKSEKRRTRRRKGTGERINEKAG